MTGDTNNAWDIFVHDWQTGATSRVSVATGGAQGSGYALYPAISADGRYVTFHSNSSLDIADNFGSWDVYIHDLQTGTTSLLLVDSGALSPAISSDGRYVAFLSNASGLVPGDTNNNYDVFVRDRQLGTTSRVSVATGGLQVFGGTGGFSSEYYPSISGDGQSVAFPFIAGDLVEGDTNGVYDIFVNYNIYNPTLTPTATATDTPTLTPTSTATNTPSPTPQDRWYTGNSRSSAYGARAFISAPEQPPVLVGSGESNWVSISQPYWIQAGWYYYQGGNYARSYVEVNAPSGYIPRYNYDVHFWGTNIEYEIRWSASNIWCAYVSGELKNCHDIGRSAPTTFYGWSEVHLYPQNELDTYFSRVYYMDVNDNWFLFDQSGWREDAPYVVDRTNNYEYHNYLP